MDLRCVVGPRDDRPHVESLILRGVEWFDRASSCSVCNLPQNANPKPLHKIRNCERILSLHYLRERALITAVQELDSKRQVGVAT